MCSPTYYAVSLIKFVIVFSFCLLETFLLSVGGKARGTLPLAPGGLTTRIPGFHSVQFSSVQFSRSVVSDSVTP